jgi:hypothetical protein
LVFPIGSERTPFLKFRRKDRMPQGRVAAFDSKKSRSLTAIRARRGWVRDDSAELWRRLLVGEAALGWVDFECAHFH